jgi:hypothetical protein
MSAPSGGAIRSGTPGILVGVGVGGGVPGRFVVGVIVGVGDGQPVTVGTGVYVGDIVKAAANNGFDSGS